MSKPVFFALPGNETLADSLVRALGGDRGEAEIRRFPDQESYIRILSDVGGRDAVLVCTLDRPDPKILQLLFLAGELSQLRAQSVGLVAPYLAYLRQDTRFHPGEALTSMQFARIVGRHLNWLVTIDPHLHRYHALDEIYDVPATALHAAPLLADWVGKNVESPVIIGPDAESEQWVRAAAERIGCAFSVLKKIRHGDRDVEVSIPDVERFGERTPVLFDDVVSSGQTMIEVIGHLRAAGTKPPIVAVVHAVFAGEALKAIRTAGAAQVVSTNTIPHETNVVDVTALLAEGIRPFL